VLLLFSYRAARSDGRTAASGQESQPKRKCESLDGFNSKSQRADATLAAIARHRRIELKWTTNAGGMRANMRS
jgi:hypothetical protein